jgi:hypothetical protein
VRRLRKLYLQGLLLHLLLLRSCLASSASLIPDFSGREGKKKMRRRRKEGKKEGRERVSKTS